MKIDSRTFSHPFVRLFVLFCCSFAIVILSQNATIAYGAPTEQAVEIAESSTPANVTTMMAGLSDEQVRQMLIAELEKDAQAHLTEKGEQKQLGPIRFFNNILNALQHSTDGSEKRYTILLQEVPQIVPTLHKAYLQLCPVGSNHGAMINLLWILLFIVIGLITEFFFTRLITKHYFQNDDFTSEKATSTERFSASLVNGIPQLLGVFVFLFAAYTAYNLTLGTDDHFIQLVFLSCILVLVTVRITHILLKLIISPANPAFRLVPISCPSAKRISRLVLGITTYIVSVMMLAIVVERLGGNSEAAILLLFMAASLLLFATGVVIFFTKNRVKEYILSDSENGNDRPSWGRRQFAAIWHFLAILYLLLLWVLLINNLGDPTHRNGGSFILSFCAVPLWFILDKIGQWVVKYSVEFLGLSGPEPLGEEATEEDINKQLKDLQLTKRIYGFVRVTLILGVSSWVATLWNINIPLISYLSDALLDSFVIFVFALISWKFISDWIERKIQESTPEKEDANEDDEWGAAAKRGRAYTLLPMVRKVLGTVIMVMLTMTILSQLGVDIGPLLAGAGVIGLAVGFGAQKLVADVFSGFFYLLDDAFRVGEYVTAGSISGSVESISLRNIFLRHHRGMLQIIPHSELGAITNYMRGGMVIKFNLDFPYDSNIDQIRKIIKKVGVAMMDDEELGPGFIQPVKSQGVREITNSVMTIRVKFTAHPGKHFLIRREAYKRITEALNKKDIFYAHRKVIVDVPQHLEQNPQVIEAAGAAAAATIQAEEEQKGVTKVDDPTV